MKWKRKGSSQLSLIATIPCLCSHYNVRTCLRDSAVNDQQGGDFSPTHECGHMSLFDVQLQRHAINILVFSYSSFIACALVKCLFRLVQGFCPMCVLCYFLSACSFGFWNLVYFYSVDSRHANKVQLTQLFLAWIMNSSKHMVTGISSTVVFWNFSSCAL